MAAPAVEPLLACGVGNIIKRRRVWRVNCKQRRTPVRAGCFRQNLIAAKLFFVKNRLPIDAAPRYTARLRFPGLAGFI